VSCWLWNFGTMILRTCIEFSYFFFFFFFFLVNYSPGSVGLLCVVFLFTSLVLFFLSPFQPPGPTPSALRVFIYIHFLCWAFHVDILPITLRSCVYFGRMCLNVRLYLPPLEIYFGDLSPRPINPSVSKSERKEKLAENVGSSILIDAAAIWGRQRRRLFSLDILFHFSRSNRWRRKISMRQSNVRAFFFGLYSTSLQLIWYRTLYCKLRARNLSTRTEAKEKIHRQEPISDGIKLLDI
jgi:hypothetical protein